MTNAEWKELIKREFNVSGNIAKQMLHEMMEVKKRNTEERKWRNG